MLEFSKRLFNRVVAQQGGKSGRGEPARLPTVHTVVVTEFSHNGNVQLWTTGNCLIRPRLETRSRRLIHLRSERRRLVTPEVCDDCRECAAIEEHLSHYLTLGSKQRPPRTTHTR